MTTDLVIDVHGLSKSFGDHLVVDRIDLSVRRGEVFGFLGPNGSGKTTTIRMLCGLLTADAGTGMCLGFDILTESIKIKQRVGYMTQKYSFYTDLTVEENLSFIARIYNIPDRKAQVQQVLKHQGLYSRRNQLTGHLSGGWKQRVALAACLLHKPDLLLLDEPTSGIDPIARRDFWDTIHALSEQGVTTLMSTHYMDEAERCTRLAYLAYGKLLVTGTVDYVIEKTNLKTWEISGEVTTALLQEIKRIDGVTQAALFGRKIHVCALDDQLIEHALHRLQSKVAIKWMQISPTLEDAFIHMVKESHGELS